MPPTWNDGMLESWNNGQKRITSVFGSRLLGSIFTFLPSMFIYEPGITTPSGQSWHSQIRLNFITKCALATDTFKSVVHDGYPGRNKAAAMVASLPAFANRR